MSIQIYSSILYQMKKHINRKGPSYLDVAEFMLSGPFSPSQQPRFRPIEQEISQVPHLQQPNCSPMPPHETRRLLLFHYLQTLMQNLTPLSRPLYIEIEEGEPSPYLKELLSKVGSSEIEFLDFTLEGNGEESQEDNEQFQQQGKQQKSMSIIAEQQQQVSNGENTIRDGKTPLINCQFNPEQYIPNMHLLDIDPLFLRIQHFTQTMSSLKQSSLEEQKEFIYLYLTDEDLEVYKDASVEELVAVVGYNLSSIGSISRLERKARVSRYLQKKKRRIWKKKINYDCRKKVADNRLRVKGKFVTREQACLMLGVELCSQQDLKELLKANYHRMII